MSSALLRRGLAIALVASLAMTLATALPATADPYQPGSAQRERPVAGETAKPRSVGAIRTGAPVKRPAPVWPKATTTEVDPGATTANKVAATPVSAVAVGGKQVSKVKIETFDHARSLAAGVDGVVFRVSGGQARVSVDYSAFRWAYGADWASRLRLTELPECALTTPDLAECRGTVVEATNDNKKATVVSAKATPAGGALMALAAGTSSGSGTYSATSLAATSTWESGNNSGGFVWSYPLRMPPATGGPVPSVSLDYSSAAVDGLMASTNNQPSWAGQGFQLASNFIERRYTACFDDMANGARNTVKTGDLCWATDNATLSMSGRAGELIKEPGSSNRWRLREDDNTFVERRTGNTNGARDGEHWVVTTEGTQYWFGRSAQSTLTVPVAGNHNGEPCAATLFNDSFCTQAYRWNLEYVVDTHGNTMMYTYVKETNKYARNGSTTDLVAYDRGSTLRQIDYGTRVDRTETAPMQVLFDTGDRCLADCGVHDATHWTDVPWDQSCDTSPCRTGSPTFWSTKRLDAVTTKVGGVAVEKWTLGHTYPDPGDGTRPALWLDKVSHQGLVNETTTLPDIRFVGVQKSNRVDTHSDQHAAMKWWRVKTIFTDTGGRVDVNYSDPDCVPGSRMPDANALQDNALRCYPVRWKADGAPEPILDFFHKYVVNSITETDLTGGGPDVSTRYDYVGGAAWHYTDDDGLIKADDKTWSVWRGYGAVRTTKGIGDDRAVSETRYFRGMHGDKTPTGSKNVVLPAIAIGGIPAATDENAFAGVPREIITYNGPNDDEVSATVSELWQSPPTASRTNNGVTVHARHTGVSGTRTRTKLDGGRGYRTTTASTVFDETYGLAVRSEDLADDSVVGDEKCAIVDYARNTDSWIVGTASRKRTFVVDCAKALAGVGLRDDDIASDDRTYYDNKQLGAAPSKGDVTKTESLKTNTDGVATYRTDVSTEYDVYGRSTKSTDVKGSTTTAYVPAAGGPVTQTVVTNPMNFVTTTTLAPAWQLPVLVVDPNQFRTESTYDGLGRITAVWQPGRDRAQSASYVFSYLTRTSGPVVVTTKTLNAVGQYITSYQLLDGLLRPRQTQKPDASGTTSFAVVDDIHYDTAGRPVRANEPYVATRSPGTELFRPTEVIPRQTTTVYDGAGRATASILKKNAPVASPGGTEVFRTTTYYAGDRTDVTPPAGGTATSTLVNAEGLTVGLRQYHSGVAVGSTDPTGFDATTYSYDRRGLVAKVVDPKSNAWTYDYDVRSRQVRAVDPDKGTTTSTYDDADLLESTTDGRGTTLAYTYDALRRKTSLRDGSPSGPKRAEWVYDTLSSGAKVNGQLIKSIRYAGANAYVTETVGFTRAYQPTSTKVTIPAVEANLAGTYTYVHTYNPNGSPNTLRFPASGDVEKETVTYSYDALGQPIGQRTGYGVFDDTDMVASTGYTSFGELGSYKLTDVNSGDVDVVKNYDETTRRLAQISTSKETAPTTVADIRYGYDDAGNITKIAESVGGDNQCFRTDHLRRLTEAWTPASGDCAVNPVTAGLGGPAKYWQSFSYDTAGDRTKLVEHATTSGVRTTNYTPTAGKHTISGTTTTDSVGTRSAAYGYDAVGNTITRPTPTSGVQTMTWDAEGHLATSTDTTGESSFVHDADGGRLIRRDPAGKTLYLPGQEVRFSSVTGAKSCTRSYTHAGQLIATRTAAGLTWVSSDHNGTAGITIDTSPGQVVGIRRTLPFGEERGKSGVWSATFDKGFVGGTNDNTGLTHLGAREYDAVLGRFVSVDPLMDLLDPQQWNSYAYGNNSPITFSDPSGLAFKCGPDGVGCGARNYDKVGSGGASTTTQLGTITQPQGLAEPFTPNYNEPYREIGFWESMWKSAEINMMAAEYAGAMTTICQLYGKLACDLIRAYGDTSGKDFVLDPLGLANSDVDFGARHKESREYLVGEAVKQCGGAPGTVCDASIDSQWRDVAFRSDSTNAVAIGNMKYRVHGSVQVVVGPDGNSQVRGNYNLDIYKNWDFDPDDSFGPISLKPFSEMPNMGMARAFIVRGSSNVSFSQAGN